MEQDSQVCTKPEGRLANVRKSSLVEYLYICVLRAFRDQIVNVRLRDYCVIRNVPICDKRHELSHGEECTCVYE